LPNRRVGKVRRRPLSQHAVLERSRCCSCNSLPHVHTTISERVGAAGARQSGPVAQGTPPCCQPVCSSWAGRSWHPCRSLRKLRRGSAPFHKKQCKMPRQVPYLAPRPNRPAIHSAKRSRNQQLAVLLRRDQAGLPSVHAGQRYTRYKAQTVPKQPAGSKVGSLRSCGEASMPDAK